MRCWTLKRARITNGIEGVNYKLKQITWRMRRWGETGGQDGSDRDNNVLGWA